VISPNGVDLARFKDLPEPAEARRMLGLPGGESGSGLTVGYTGHLYAGRGMKMLEHLAQRLPSLHFLWVGGRPEDVRTWSDRLADQGIGNVSLVGFIENQRLPLYQAAADVLLMPYERSIAGSSGGNSAAYASPMKMFEYMACRRAILSSDLPVIREVLNETNAVLCPPEDEQGWEKALQSLVSDAQRCQALADQAWLDVQRYSWEQRARSALAGLEG
jgi:glycosyltransferase involved in cell wall biosynthesis